LAETSPLITGMNSKISQSTEYKSRKRSRTGEEVVKRYEKSIIGKLGTT
jgi:hypothetical protein